MGAGWSPDHNCVPEPAFNEHCTSKRDTKAAMVQPGNKLLKIMSLCFKESLPSPTHVWSIKCSLDQYQCNSTAGCHWEQIQRGTGWPAPRGQLHRPGSCLLTQLDLGSAWQPRGNKWDYQPISSVLATESWFCINLFHSRLYMGRLWLPLMHL